MTINTTSQNLRAVIILMNLTDKLTLSRTFRHHLQTERWFLISSK